MVRNCFFAIAFTRALKGKEFLTDQEVKEIIDKELDGTGSDDAAVYSANMQNMADPKVGAFETPTTWKSIAFIFADFASAACLSFNCC